MRLRRGREGAWGLEQRLEVLAIHGGVGALQPEDPARLAAAGEIFEGCAIPDRALLAEVRHPGGAAGNGLRIAIQGKAASEMSKDPAVGISGEAEDADGGQEQQPREPGP